MSREGVLGRLVCLRLVIDTDAFLVLALHLVLDTFLFLLERLLVERLLAEADAFLFLAELLDRFRPCPVLSACLTF